jgi:ribosomal-protein-alanine N-acetyltransferase
MNKKLIYGNYPRLESDEILLKKLEPRDADDLYKILTNERLYRYKPGKPLKTLDAVKNVIGHYERDFNKQKMIFLGIYYKKADTKLVGIAEMFDFDEKTSRAEMGYTVNEKFWGNGIATNATKLMLDYLFNTISANSVQAMSMPVNIKSKNVLERCGFTFEGTLRQIRFWVGHGIVDLDMYSILKTDYFI